jgi:integrase
MSARKAKKKSKDQWPYVRWAEKENAWKVDTRTKTAGGRSFFKTREEADSWAAKQRQKRAAEGTLAFDDAELRKFGWTTRKAVEFALKHLRQKAKSASFQHASDEFAEFKSGRVGDRRLVDLKQKLKQLAGIIGADRLMAEITAADLLAALDVFANPTTRNGFRKELVALWRFSRAKPREWTTLALDNVTLPLVKENEKARTILTLAEAKRLMAASKDPEVRALNAMVLFGGLRREEVEGLDWSAVDFRNKIINVSADVSKVHRERFSPILPNLRKWLTGLAEAAKERRRERLEKERELGKEIDDAEFENNPIVTRTLMHAFRRTWKEAGLLPWPQDAHRHTFISCRRTLVGDAQTALEAGTSESIIKRHYKRPVREADAKAYFLIVPTK